MGSLLSLGANNLRPVIGRGFLGVLPDLPASICESSLNDRGGATESFDGRARGDAPVTLRGKPSEYGTLGTKGALDARGSLGGVLNEYRSSWSFDCCWLSACCAFSMLVRLTPLIIRAFTVSDIATLKFLSVFSFERSLVHISAHRPARQPSACMGLDIGRGTKLFVFRMTSRCASSCQLDPFFCEFIILSLNGKTSLANSISLPNRSLLRIKDLSRESTLAEKAQDEPVLAERDLALVEIFPTMQA